MTRQTEPMPIRRSASTRPPSWILSGISPRSLGVVVVTGLVMAIAGCSSGPSAAPAPVAAETTVPSASTPSTSTPSASTPPATTSPTASARTSASPTKDASSAKPAEVPATLKFTGTTVDQEPFDGASLAGKPTLVWFWAPWCPTCRSQIPQVQEIAKAHGADANVIGVGSLDGGAAIKTFADSAPGITHLTDESGEIWRHFSVQQQSSFVLLDAAGEVVLKAGYGGSDELGQRVDELVGS